MPRSIVNHPSPASRRSEPPFETPPPVGHRVPETAHPDRAECLGLLRAMMASRRIEERTVELYRQGLVIGGCYTGIGNEATSVGSAWALAKTDVLVPTQRDMGSHLVHGHTPLDVMRQYMKRATSQTRGRDSGLHLGQEGANVVGMISHLAHMMPVAAGVALAERQLGRTTAVLTTIGDGATSLGDFHESLNFMAVQKLPVLVVIVNNQYAYSTPRELQYACARLADRAIGYGMPGEQLDGTDVLEVLDAAKRAVTRGREGYGPTLLESVTMRMRGHSEHDDFKYVSSELLERWRKFDPIARFTEYVLARGHAVTSVLEVMSNEVAAEIEEAIEKAKSEPAPDPRSAADGVFRSWAPDWTVPAGDTWEPSR